jgi:hypothetical protein
MRTFVESIVCSVAATLALPAFAAVQSFEGNAPAWQAAVGAAPITTITFDTIPGSNSNPIVGNEFSSFAGSPVFTSIVGNGVYVGNAAFSQIPVPPSPPNMLSPSSCSPSCEGVIRLTFTTPMTAVGATFVDVENEFALTGYSLVLGAVTPSISFTSAPGDLSFKFLGFVSDVPFTAVDIHFTTGPSIDGALLDNLVYAPVPEPHSYVLWGIGALLAAARARRQRPSNRPHIAS